MSCRTSVRKLPKQEKENEFSCAVNIRSKDMVLFDWDGTLCNPWPRFVSVMNQIATETTRKPPLIPYTAKSLERAYHQGKSFSHVLKEDFSALQNADAKDLMHLVWSLYRINSTPVATTPGALQLVTNLVQNKIDVAIVTNKNNSVFAEELETIPQLHRIFKGKTLAEGDGYALKPGPDMLLQMMKVFGVKSENTLMIGDSKDDYLAAQAAGVQCILISGENIEKLNHLQNSHPKAIVHRTLHSVLSMNAELTTLLEI